jgi:16S rRNA (cytosine1402-N4)-methyltransferase
MSAPAPHIPVLLAEVTQALAPRDGGIYVDGTFGAGGYTRAILAAADCRVLGIDRDPAAVERGRILAQEYSGRLDVIEGRFGDMTALLVERDVSAVDGIALDIGVSSPQIDEPERGFSFRFDGPLDMRMESAGESAADIVNTADETELADIIFHLGEERHARRVARAIAAARREAPITRTARLAEVVRSAVPGSRDGIDPATRTFQALRIRVNDELGELVRGLAAAERALRPGGHLAVVSFHSLEDRLVKTFLKERASPPVAPSRHAPPSLAAERAPSFRLLTSKPVAPGEAEIRTNPRARSSRLRVAERTSAPAWPETGKESR